MTNEQYEEQLKERDDLIDNLFIALQALRNNQYAEIIPLLDRTVRERNELERQRNEAMHHFEVLNKDLTNCKELTKHFRA